MTTPSDLRRRRRASARAALYLSLALLGAAAAGFWGWLERSGPRVEIFDWRAEDHSDHPAVEFLRRYIAVDTSLPDGDPPAGAELLAERLRAAGIESTIERVGAKDVNFWAVIEGDDPRAVVLHHHIDVEAVRDPSAWHHPPFSGTIDGPWLYGRGAFDMKGVAVAQLEAFLAVAERAAAGRRPARSVILLATSGEETGSELGMRWILRRHPELVERFGVVLTEGGVVEGRAVDDLKYWGTEFVQRRLLWVTLCGDDRERLERLRAELLAEARGLTGLTVAPELEAFLAHYAPTRDRADWRRLLADPRALARDPIAFSVLPTYLAAMFRNQAVPQAVRETSGGWEMVIHVLLVPGARPEAALAELLPPARTLGLGMTVYDEGGAAHGSPADHPLLEEIRRVISARHPGAPIGPMYLPWTRTDARFLRAAGVAAYGFSPFMVLTPDVLDWLGGDTVDERIGVHGFVDGVEIYTELLEGLTSPPQGAGE